MELITKDPQSIEAQGFDWDIDRYLTRLSSGETITASTWTVSGPDSALTLSGATIVSGSKQTKITMTGGTLGCRYVVVNHITTSGGTQDDRSFVVLIEQL